jgi:hypothetical protein
MRPEGLARKGQAWRVTGAAFAQAKDVTAEARPFDPVVIRRITIFNGHNVSFQFTRPKAILGKVFRPIQLAIGTQIRFRHARAHP